MAVTVEELRAVLRMELKPFQRDLQQANGISAKAARQIEATFRASNKRLDSIGRGMAASITGPLAGITAAASIAEVTKYADAWTVAGNKLKAASQISGTQARSLEDLNTIANGSRSGIAETAELYAKLLRSTKGVAESEGEVAKATDIVNKSFKAGGAAASEQAAGILQLAQGLGSGVLQGDELKSVRENAPLLAQAIADYFGVTVAGLKDLGSEGKLTSDKIFKAILSAQPQIEAAFGATNQTIGDGVTRVNNALTQYIGQTDASLGGSQRLVAGLNALADNFDSTADAALQVAGVIAGALIGRSLIGMITKLGIGTRGVYELVKALRAASSLSGVTSAFGGLGAAAGPVGLLIGGLAAGAFVLLENNAAKAANNVVLVSKEMDRLGISTKGADGELSKTAATLQDLADIKAEETLRATRAEMERLQNGSGFTGVPKGAAASPEDVVSAANRYNSVGDFFQSSEDKAAKASIAALAQAFIDASLTADQVIAKSKEISMVNVSDGVVRLNAELRDSARYFEGVRGVAATLGVSPEIDKLTDSLANAETRLRSIASAETVKESQVDKVIELTDKFKENGEGADEAKRALDAFAATNPKMGPIVDILNSIIEKLIQVRAEANSTTAAIQKAIAGNLGVGGEGRDDRPSKDPYLQGRAAGNALVAEQERLNSLSKSQLAIEKEKAEIKKKAGAAGAILTDKQIDDLASANAAADTRRSAEGKKPKATPAVKKTAESRFDADIQSVKDRTAALTEETAAVGLSYQQQEKRKLALDLEQQALADLREEARKKGETDLDSIKLSPEMVSNIDAASDAYSKQAEILRQVTEAHEKSEQAAQDFYAAFKEGTIGAITGANSLGEALSGLTKKLGDMLLNSAFDSLFQPKSGNNPGGSFGSIFSGITKFLGLKDGGPVRRYAGGGGISGPGGPRSDSIPIMASNGEFMVNAKATKKNRAVLEAINRGLNLNFRDGGIIAAPNVPNLQSVSGRGQPSGSSGPTIIVNAPNAAPGMEQKIKDVVSDAFNEYERGNTARVAHGYSEAARRNMI